MSTILGMNERNLRYIRPHNLRGAIHLADDKIKTCKILGKAGLPTPKLYGILKKVRDVEEFDWSSLPDSFVIKPNMGLGGGGIVVMIKKIQDGLDKETGAKKEFPFFGIKELSEEENNNQSVLVLPAWEAADGTIWTVEDLKSHSYNIIDGNFSITEEPDAVIIQKRLVIHPILRKYAYKGAPDVRIIVFNRVPVMAEMRLPTKYSRGKANLALGAIGVGIDLAQGVTTTAVVKKPRRRWLEKHPETGQDLSGLEIPFWDEILELSIRAQEISHLGFLGVDIVIDKDQGPMILELNARSGLEIQNANLTGLARRLERVEGLKIKSIKHGIRVAKELFGGEIEKKVEDMTGKEVLGIIEPIKIMDKEGELHKVLAKIDTGAGLTSIDSDLVKKLGFEDAINIFEKYTQTKKLMTREEARKYDRELTEELKRKHKDIVDTAIIHSPHGTTWRLMIPFIFYISGIKVTTKASVTERKNLKYPVIIGRKDLKDFLVDPTKKKDRFSKF